MWQRMKLQEQEKDYYGSFYYLEYILCKPNPLLYKEDTGRMFYNVFHNVVD